MHRIPALRRAIVEDTPFWRGLAVTIGVIALVTAARWVTDRGSGGMQFGLYFPFILMIAVLLGWRFGALAALLSGIIANRLLRSDPVLFYIDWVDASRVLWFLFSCALLVYAGDTLRRLVRELEEAKAREQMLSGELRHRAKNTLAIVGAIASLTARRSTGADFFPAFADRIDALDRATELLAGEGGELGSIERLVEHAVAPFRGGDNFRLNGPACEIPDASSIPLMLVLHELCTNAAKHGALTVADGMVSIVWSADSGDGVLRMHWSERGGPPVKQTREPGMGSTLMRAQKGLRKVDLRLPRAGAECDIEVEGARAL